MFICHVISYVCYKPILVIKRIVEVPSLPFLDIGEVLLSHRNVVLRTNYSLTEIFNKESKKKTESGIHCICVKQSNTNISRYKKYNLRRS